jgi:hypothetical protein
MQVKVGNFDFAPKASNEQCYQAVSVAESCREEEEDLIWTARFAEHLQAVNRYGDHQGT